MEGPILGLKELGGGGGVKGRGGQLSISHQSRPAPPLDPFCHKEWWGVGGEGYQNNPYV
jgi:hypothetical protein